MVDRLERRRVAKDHKGPRTRADLVQTGGNLSHWLQRQNESLYKAACLIDSQTSLQLGIIQLQLSYPRGLQAVSNSFKTLILSDPSGFRNLVISVVGRGSIGV